MSSPSAMDDLLSLAGRFGRKYSPPLTPAPFPEKDLPSERPVGAVTPQAGSVRAEARAYTRRRISTYLGQINTTSDSRHLQRLEWDVAVAQRLVQGLEGQLGTEAIDGKLTHGLSCLSGKMTSHARSLRLEHGNRLVRLDLRDSPSSPALSSASPSCSASAAARTTSDTTWPPASPSISTSSPTAGPYRASSCSTSRLGSITPLTWSSSAAGWKTSLWTTTESPSSASSNSCTRPQRTCPQLPDDRQRLRGPVPRLIPGLRPLQLAQRRKTHPRHLAQRQPHPVARQHGSPPGSCEPQNRVDCARRRRSSATRTRLPQAA